MGALTGCASTRSSLERFEYSRLLMGVEARVTLYAPDEATAIDAARAAFDRIGELDAVMSDYRAHSELNRLCDRAGGPPVEVSDDLFHVLAVSVEVSEASDGAFDVTVKPLVDLWREARRTKELPTPERVAAARSRVGWRRIHLDREHRTVALDAGTRLDLGGVAKGFACQSALSVLGEHGIDSALMEMGGDVAIGDAPPGHKGWKIQIGDGPATTIVLANTSLATSGDSEQYVEIEGQRYAHVIDPRTGLGALRSLTAVVAARDGAVADAWATAVALLGCDEHTARLVGPAGARILRCD
jgi:thiamine biosynthesis lipoprotein